MSKKPAGPPATAKTVAKPAHHAHMTKAQHQRAKAAAAKAARTRKHNAAAKHHKTGKHSKRVGLANAGDGLACCAAEALAMSLRLAGWPVSDQDVADLYWLTANDADAGASIEETLAAIDEHGLGRRKPLRHRARFFPREYIGQPVAAVPADFHELRAGARLVPPVDGLDRHAETISKILDREVPFGSVGKHSLILGVELPGAHAVLVTADGWWSWGEPFAPADWPGLVVEEAWAVSWQ